MGGRIPAADQFALYIVATTWLIQRGSSESKKPGDVGTGSEKEQKIGLGCSPLRVRLVNTNI
jgi:hypothetical protein